MIVLDTHVLVWLSSNSQKLGSSARRTLDRAWNQGLVAASAITFWEAALLLNKGRLKLPASAEEWRHDLRHSGLVELAIDGAIAIRAVDFSSGPEDPADRLIVATALHHDAALMTADERLLAWKHSLVRYDARN